MPLVTTTRLLAPVSAADDTVKFSRFRGAAALQGEAARIRRSRIEHAFARVVDEYALELSWWSPRNRRRTQLL